MEIQSVGGGGRVSTCNIFCTAHKTEKPTNINVSCSFPFLLVALATTVSSLVDEDTVR